MVGGVKVVASGIDALAAVAGVLDGERASGHGKVVVGLHAGRAAVFGVFLVIGHASGDGYRVGAALYQHIVVGSYALLEGCCSLDYKRAAGELNVVLAFEAVPGSAAGANFDGGIVHQADVVVGGNGRLVLLVEGIDGEQAAAAEYQLGLTEKYRLEVFFALLGIGCRLAVGQLVGTPDHDERTLLVLVVERRSVGVGDAGAVKDDGLLLGSVHLEESVGGGTGQLVYEHFSAGVVDRHFVAVDGHVAIAVALDGSIVRVGKSYGDLAGKSGGGYVVVRGGVARGVKSQ